MDGTRIPNIELELAVCNGGFAPPPLALGRNLAG